MTYVKRNADFDRALRADRLHPKPRRFLFCEGVMCRVSFLPMAYCARCESGVHKQDLTWGPKA